MSKVSCISLGLFSQQLEKSFGCISIGGFFPIFDGTLSTLSLGVKYPKLVIKVIDDLGNAIEGASVSVAGTQMLTNTEGFVYHDYEFGIQTKIEISHQGKITASFAIKENHLLDFPYPLFDQVKVYQSMSCGTLISLSPDKMDNKFLV